MEKQEKKNYEAPALTVVSFKAERGYSASNKSVTSSRSYNDDGIGQEQSDQSFNSHF